MSSDRSAVILRWVIGCAARRGAPWRAVPAIALAASLLVGVGAVPVASGQSIPLSPAAQAAGAQITYSHGIEFVTIGSVGNAGWDGAGTSGPVVGRGGVSYEYRIGRFEVTTAQWAEFFNAAFDRPPSEWLPHLSPPSRWGAVGATPMVPGGLRWSVPAGNEMRPAGGLSWRVAAMYCNWLHNDRSHDRAAFLNGAYDVSTFGYDDNGFTDQITHSAGARYWVPTWDEWIKAAHFDPNRQGPGQGGYWKWANASETVPAYGPPGVRVRRLGEGGPVADPNGVLAEANGFWDSRYFPGFNPFAISLGAYPLSQSPWGLLDTAGGTSEWIEETNSGGVVPPTARLYEGSGWAFESNAGDHIRFFGGDFPSLSTYELGFRIAASIPSPSASVATVLSLLLLSLRRRREGADDAEIASYRLGQSRVRTARAGCGRTMSAHIGRV